MAYSSCFATISRTVILLISTDVRFDIFILWIRCTMMSYYVVLLLVIELVSAELVSIRSNESVMDQTKAIDSLAAKTFFDKLRK